MTVVDEGLQEERDRGMSVEELLKMVEKAPSLPEDFVVLIPAETDSAVVRRWERGPQYTVGSWWKSPRCP